VFVNLIDPVSGGFVESLARPGGNTTGFLLFEYGISGKWLELLKEIAPRVTRVAVLRDPTQSGGTGQLGAIQSAASQLGVEFRPVGVRDAREIERSITDFGRGSTTERKVRKQLAKGVGILRVAKSLGIGTGTVQRIANELR
jgi:putative ABC transport system substrate-binding protein